MNYDKPKLRDMLAAEYALGTLHGAARRRFERLLARDAKLRGAVEQWQQRLAPLDYVVPAVQPPARVWLAIARRIAPATAAPSPARDSVRTPGWWNSLGFWRTLGLSASALAAALLIYLRAVPTPEPVQSYVAVLVDAKARPAVAVNYNQTSREIVVSVVEAQTLTPDQALELWALPQSGAPRSLGLIPASGRVSLTPQAGVSLADVPAFAVSLEPKGGSPTGAPTGPVLYSGASVKL